MQVGKRGYDPVVSTSMAKGMAKLGKRACTRASLASDASLSAVSTNKMVCCSRKLEIICSHRHHLREVQSRVINCVIKIHFLRVIVFCDCNLYRHVPHTFRLSQRCLPTSPGLGDVQIAAWYDWQTGQSQFSCNGNTNQKLKQI